MRFRPVRKTKRLIYIDQLQVTGVKREVMANWGDGQRAPPASWGRGYLAFFGALNIAGKEDDPRVWCCRDHPSADLNPECQ